MSQNVEEAQGSPYSAGLTTPLVHLDPLYDSCCGVAQATNPWECDEVERANEARRFAQWTQNMDLAGNTDWSSAAPNPISSPPPQWAESGLLAQGWTQNLDWTRNTVRTSATPNPPLPQWAEPGRAESHQNTYKAPPHGPFIAPGYGALYPVSAQPFQLGNSVLTPGAYEQYNWSVAPTRSFPMSYVDQPDSMNASGDWGNEVQCGKSCGSLADRNIAHNRDLHRDILPSLPSSGSLDTTTWTSPQDSAPEDTEASLSEYIEATAKKSKRTCMTAKQGAEAMKAWLEIKGNPARFAKMSNASAYVTTRTLDLPISQHMLDTLTKRGDFGTMREKPKISRRGRGELTGDKFDELVFIKRLSKKNLCDRYSIAYLATINKLWLTADSTLKDEESKASYFRDTICGRPRKDKMLGTSNIAS